MKSWQSSFFITIVLSSLLGLYYSIRDEKGPEQNDQEVYSTLESARKAHIPTGAIPTSLLFASDVKTQKKQNTNRENLKSLLLKKSYYRNFTKGAIEIGNSIELLEKEHEILLQNMRREGIKIDPVTNLRPRLAIAITYHLNLSLGELTLQDLDSLELSSREWYIIKTFSESKDFVLMLKRNSLTNDFVQLDNLKQYYSNS